MNRVSGEYAIELPLKPLSSDAIPKALAKAERYRMLNEAWESVSICRDVLNADPGNQDALVGVLLGITQELESATREDVDEAESLAAQLEDPYRRHYYTGVVLERRAKELLSRGTLGVGPAAYDFLRRAMEAYEEAEKCRPEGNDESVLRWNTCARLIMQHRLRAAPGPPHV
ncbi:MAG: hypothetical protein OEY63_01475 [Gemmatimonadota bacterium]|nr:hypothetical protein [Gemmatimonadota bacterium]MDH5804198.1 hypothetical protein [Gemmatimonadota bacterium]